MISGGLSGSETVNLDDIDMDLVKAESDLYLNATTFGSAVIVAAALVGISVYGDTSLGATLSYLLMEFEASINILKTEYERYKQSKLYQEYLDGNEESGIEFYNNTRSEQVKTACIALGYLADLVFMSLDGLITKKLEEKTAQKTLEKNAADEATEQLLKEQDEWAIQYAEIEATREAEKKAAENAGKEFVEDASKETAEEVIQESATRTEKEFVRRIREGESKGIFYPDYETICQRSVHNPEKNKVMLGKYDGGGPTSYITKAGDEYTYFDLGSDWNVIKRQYGFTDDEMFSLFNESFLDDGINAGKTFYFSHNPINDSGALGKEYQYLLKNNYIWDEATMTMKPR